jgi:hypothetical protein
VFPGFWYCSKLVQTWLVFVPALTLLLLLADFVPFSTRSIDIELGAREVVTGHIREDCPPRRGQSSYISPVVVFCLSTGLVQFLPLSHFGHVNCNLRVLHRTLR